MFSNLVVSTYNGEKKKEEEFGDCVETLSWVSPIVWLSCVNEKGDKQNEIEFLPICSVTSMRKMDRGAQNLNFKCSDLFFDGVVLRMSENVYT